MQLSEIIKHPILTEKTYPLMEKGIYTFAVDKRTNKAEVKKAIQFIFDVKVKKVNIMNIRKKPKKMGKYNGFLAGYKKVIVTLDKGSISLFEDEQNAPVEVKAKEIKNTNSKISEAEKKAAAKIQNKLAAKTTGGTTKAKPAAAKPAAAKPATTKPAAAKPATTKAKPATGNATNAKKGTNEK